MQIRFSNLLTVYARETNLRAETCASSRYIPMTSGLCVLLSDAWIANENCIVLALQAVRPVFSELEMLLCGQI